MIAALRLTRQAMGLLGQLLLEYVVNTSAPPRSPVTQNTTIFRIGQHAHILGSVRRDPYQCDDDKQVHHDTQAFQNGQLPVREDVDKRCDTCEHDSDQHSNPAFVAMDQYAYLDTVRRGRCAVYLWMQKMGDAE